MSTLIHVFGTVFTEEETGLTIDANKVVAQCRRAAGEIQQLRASLGTIAQSVLDACVRQQEKNRSLENLNLVSIMNEVLDTNAPEISATVLLSRVESVLYLALLHQSFESLGPLLDDVKKATARLA